MQNKPDIGIIGTGKVGLSLIGALKDKYPIAWVVARSEEKKQLLESYNLNLVRRIEDIPNPASINIFAVPDQNIEGTSAEFADKFGDLLKDKFVLHLSGSQPETLLGACKAHGAFTMKAHPYQTFFQSDGNLLIGIAWGLEADVNPAIVFEMIEATGGAPFLLDKGVRELYHLSAVMASNYLIAVTTLAKKAAERAGIDPEAFLRPIMQTTLDNMFSSKQSFPLTGPIARGDFETIEKHLEALQGHPELLNGYCRLGITTTELAAESGTLDKDAADKIIGLLKKGES